MVRRPKILTDNAMKIIYVEFYSRIFAKIEQNIYAIFFCAQ